MEGMLFDYRYSSYQYIFFIVLSLLVYFKEEAPSNNRRGQGLD